MPYLLKRDRLALDPFLEALIDSIDTVGEANYVFTRILTEAAPFVPLSYANGNAALGVLAAVSAEYYRRSMVPYENIKWAQNGDLPGFQTIPQPHRTINAAEAQKDTLS